MQNLTKRDKMMIYVIGIVLIIFLLVRLAIMPLAEKHSEISEQLETAQSTQDLMQMTIAQYGTANTQVLQSKDKFHELQSQFYPHMLNADIDQIITQCLLMYNMTPQSASINDPAVEPVQSYLHTDDTSTGSQQASSDDLSSTDDPDAVKATAEPQATNDYIEVSHLTYTALGDINDFYRFMDYVAETPALRVTRFTTSKSSRSTDNTGLVSVTINMDFYMYVEDSNMQ